MLGIAVRHRHFFRDPKKLLLLRVIHKVRSNTLLRYGGLFQVHDAIQRVDKEGIAGSIVEMGCWKGGCGAFMAYCTKKNRSNRHVWLFDSFEGLPEPSVEDVLGATNEPSRIRRGYLTCSEDDPLNMIHELDLRKNVSVIKGWFQDTVPRHKKQIRQIAILRLDADTYLSTKYCLEQLYDLVALNGFVIIDDYKNWIGCRRALYEFFCEKDVNPYIQIYPYGGVAYFRKQ